MPLILYSTDGCHLCEEAQTMLRALQALRPELAWTVVDIAYDDALFVRYGWAIPVLRQVGEAGVESVGEGDAAQAAAATADGEHLIGAAKAEAPQGSGPSQRSASVDLQPEVYVPRVGELAWPFATDELLAFVDAGAELATTGGGARPS